MSDSFERVKQILSEQLCVEKHIVNMDAELINDLGADSLDAVELMMAIEEEFDIKISDDQASEIKTVADIMALVEPKTVDA